MRYPTTPEALHRRRLIGLSVIIVMLVATAVAYAALVLSGPRSTTVVDLATTKAPLATDDPARPVTSLAALTPVDDPEVFAREVAEALFGWDTASLITRTDHLEQLLAVADPTGESTVALAADLDNYLPTPGAWTDLTRYQTRQWLVITSVTTPSLWSEAEAQAGGELMPGTTAVTIHGVRYRSGIWENQRVGTSHPVAFTIFIVCAPSHPTCHLLRLSILDEPLG